MADVGRPSELTEELLLKIRECVLDGCDLKSMAQRLGLNIDTVYGWHQRNYEGFTDKFLAYKHERILKSAEARLEVSIDSDDEKVALNAAQFALETLNKKHYSKRSELTGTDGKDLPITGFIYTDPNATNNKTDT